MPLLSLTGARCIRDWTHQQRGDRTRIATCAQTERTRPDDCRVPLIGYDRTCRTGVHGASADGDLQPNPASCARRCRRPRG